MEAVFDQIAQYYDHVFSFTQTGWLQRKQVWDYLEALFDSGTALKILEFGGGTGEDAIFLARKGHRILSTDVSEGMLDVARQKLEETQGDLDIEFQLADINHIDTTKLPKDNDLILVNFGVFNNVSPGDMEILSDKLNHLLKQGGHLIATVMPPYCLWETLFFLLRLEIRKSIRRWIKNPAYINIGSKVIPTWYYTPSRFYIYFEPHFIKEALKPVGFFIPPSYMEPYLGERKKFLHKMELYEKQIGNKKWAAARADYYLIHLIKGVN